MVLVQQHHRGSGSHGIERETETERRLRDREREREREREVNHTALPHFAPLHQAMLRLSLAVCLLALSLRGSAGECLATGSGVVVRRERRMLEPAGDTPHAV
jgi:hypothetical protein